jgi:hypothetical protein
MRRLREVAVDDEDLTHETAAFSSLLHELPSQRDRDCDQDDADDEE